MLRCLMVINNHFKHFFINSDCISLNIEYKCSKIVYCFGI